MNKIKGFEKIYGERFQMGGIIWEVENIGSNPRYIPFALTIVDVGKRSDVDSSLSISCFLEIHTPNPTLEFWRMGGHLYTLPLKPSHYESKQSFLSAIINGMQVLSNRNII
jgi:hypothetical protein